MPLPTGNPGALITTVGGIPGCRIAVHVNSIAALQVRAAARQGEWWWEIHAWNPMNPRSRKVKDGRLMVVPSLFRALFGGLPFLYFAFCHISNSKISAAPKVKFLSYFVFSFKINGLPAWGHCN